MAKLVNDHGLFMRGPGRQLAGHLLCLRGRIFSPDGDDTTGITEEEANRHNDLLDEALLNGLDERCEVKQGGQFYFTERNGKSVVVTFTGRLVSDDITETKRTVTFRRKGKTFKGRILKDSSLLRFTRTE